MRGKATYTENWEEIEKANKLDIEPPNEVYGYYDFMFREEEVETAIRTQPDKNGDREIIIYINGIKWYLKYDENLWNELVQVLNKKT